MRNISFISHFLTKKKSKHKIKINQNVFNKYKIEKENNRYFYENIFTFDNKKKKEEKD